MSLFQYFRRSVLTVMFVSIVAIGYASYSTISNIVAQQSKIQQQSITPIFSLIIEELIKPLHISQTIADARILVDLMESDSIDPREMTSYLKRLENNLGFSIFAASERSRRQYLSDGNSFVLEPEKVEWYFRVKETGAAVTAELGNKEAHRLYIDVRVNNAKGEFLGFVGISISLKEFWQKFKKHKETYGSDLIFVNSKNEVLLSSELELMGYGASIVQLDDLNWYQQAKKTLEDSASHNSALVTRAGDDFLVSQVDIEVLGWRLFLLTPMKERQSEINRTFMSNAVVILVFLIILFGVLFYLLKYFGRDLEQSLHFDSLTGLANRTRIKHGFKAIKKSGAEISLIMVDIDDFKNINDSYGHNTGDIVIKTIADLLSNGVREQDIVGRWGGEEYIILLPDADLKLAVAISERIRSKLESLNIEAGEHQLQVTASFGVTHQREYSQLSDLVSSADEALYQAKREGRNRVCHSGEVVE